MPRVSRKVLTPAREGVYIKLGVLIGERRVKVNLTQEELADKAELTRASLSNIEAGRHRIWLHDFLRVAKILEIDPIKMLREAVKNEGA